MAGTQGERQQNFLAEGDVVILATVKALWRYPVKSLGGEALSSALLGSGGVNGDRHWAIYDPVAPMLRSAKQWPALLTLRAQYLGSPALDDYGESVAPVRLLAPDGTVCHSDDRQACDRWLTAQLGRPARLRPRAPASERSFYALPHARTEQEIARETGLEAGDAPPDFSAVDTDVLAQLQSHATPPGYLYDAFPVHILTSNSLMFLGKASGLNVDVRRFRPNILLEMTEPAYTTPEQDWLGATLQIGDAVVLIDSPTSRCAMPGRPQPGFDLAPEKGMARAMAKHVDRNLGVNAKILTPGVIHAGDTVRVLERNKNQGKRT